MTTREAQKNVGNNMILDRMWQGIAAFAFVGLSYLQVLKYVRAIYPVNYCLAGAAVLLLMYMLLIPFFRKSKEG